MLPISTSVRWTKLKLIGREDCGKAARTERCDKIKYGLVFSFPWKAQDLDNSGHGWPDSRHKG